MNTIVVGGGIAGIAAAVRLAEAGARVTLLETRKKLGGRATSFTDVRTGEVLDNCQHVLLGCCTNYRDLLRRLGAADKIAWHREQYWIEAGGDVSIIRPSRLPAPLHYGLSMLRARFLSIGDAASIGRAATRIMRANRAGHEDETFGRFLRCAGQSERVISRFWAPVVVSACNMDVDRVAASVALHVFQEGFFSAADAADIGVPAAPLVELYEGVAPRIEQAGGEVLIGTSVERIGARRVALSDGRQLSADAVVCAVPAERVRRMVEPDIAERDDRFARLSEFTHSPILGVHLTFDRRVLAHPHAVLVDRSTQWLFDKGQSSEGGQRVHAVISAADDWMELDETEITRRVLDDMHVCLPESRAAALVSTRAVKERRATWAPSPGVNRLRPGAIGPSGLILAGDYTDSGWPATMEGATRSGYAAAAAALSQPADRMVVPAVRVAPLSGMFGLRL